MLKNLFGRVRDFPVVPSYVKNKHFCPVEAKAHARKKSHSYGHGATPNMDMVPPRPSLFSMPGEGDVWAAGFDFFRAGYVILGFGPNAMSPIIVFVPLNG